MAYKREYPRKTDKKSAKEAPKAPPKPKKPLPKDPQADLRLTPLRKDPDARVRTHEQREIHRTKMVQLLARGYTKDMIASYFGVSVTTIDKDWKAVVTAWKADHDDEVKDYVVTMRRKYAEAMKEAWEAWERSKEDRLRVTEEGEDHLGARKRKSSVMREGQAGDASYLRVILDCLKAERDLLGMDATKKVEVSGQVINWEMLAEGIPEDGPVPDVVVERIERAVLGYDPQAGATEHHEVIDVEPLPE